MTIPRVRAELTVLLANAEQARQGAKETIAGLDKLIATVRRLIGDDSNARIEEIGRQLALLPSDERTNNEDHNL